MEGAFRHFGGVTEDILVDNARALVDSNDGDGNVCFNAVFKAFCDHWGIRPRACRPYRARTKGKDERAVGYVKHNAMAGRAFASWDDLEAHLVWWMREIADRRVHQTTKEVPLVRFEKEKGALLAVGAQRSFVVTRSATRVVKTDATVDFFGNAYSVPYRLIGKTVEVAAQDGTVEIRAAGASLARHAEAKAGAGLRIIDAGHLKGVMRLWGAAKAQPTEAVVTTEREAIGGSALLRPLAEYEALFDGSSALAAGGAS
jgi:transposase